MPNNLSDAEEVRLLDLSLSNTDLLALTTTLPTDSAAGTEVTGGSYARQPLTWGAAASGVKATSAALSFATMPACEVFGWEVLGSGGAPRKWYGLWSERTGVATAADNLISITGHGFSDATPIVFQTGYSPAGITEGTKYFVRDATADTFKVAATSGGAVVDITADRATTVVGKVLVVTAGATLNVASGGVACSLS